MTTSQVYQEARAYIALINEAQTLGIDTSLETNPTLDTVEKLRDAVANARRSA